MDNPITTDVAARRKELTDKVRDQFRRGLITRTEREARIAEIKLGLHDQPWEVQR